MSYEVGTYIDLSHINYKKSVATAKPTQKKSFPPTKETFKRLWPVGTQFVWNKTRGSWDLRIPVAVA